MRIFICGYLIVFFLCATAMLRQYRHELAEFVQLRADLAAAPATTLRSFCASEHTEITLFALQCQQGIATRQHADVCAVATKLPQHTRRYYYLQLDCQLQSTWLHVPLPKIRQVVFG